MQAYTAHANMHVLPPLCKNCRHFMPPRHLDLSHGKCMLYAKINVVHGKLEHVYAETAREYLCVDAKDFEQLKTDF